jgi:hypothetical protein
MVSSNMPTLVIGLLQVKAEPWKSIYEKGQLPTWIKSSPPSIEIVNIYGDTPSKIVRGLDIIHETLRLSRLLQGPIHVLDRYLNEFLRKKSNPKWYKIKDEYVTSLHVKVPSMLLTLPIVEIVLFKYFLNKTKADFLYMSNTSSYINLIELEKIVQSFPISKVYGGTRDTSGEIQFMSGANRILSRDLVEKLVSNFSLWDFSHVEDVSMGKLLLGEDKNFVSIPRQIFQTKEQIDSADIVEIKKSVQFRLRSGKLKSRNDIELMHHLHEKLIN